MSKIQRTSAPNDSTAEIMDNMKNTTQASTPPADQAKKPKQQPRKETKHVNGNSTPEELFDNAIEKSDKEIPEPDYLKDEGITVKVIKSIDTPCKKANPVSVNISLVRKMYKEQCTLKISDAIRANKISDALLNMGGEYLPLDQAQGNPVCNAVVNDVRAKLKKQEFEWTHHNIGWDSFNHGEVIKLFNLDGVGASYKSKYAGKVPISLKGNSEQFKKEFSKHIKGNLRIQIVLALSVAGFIAQRIDQADINLLVNFTGNSSIGKSQVTKLCLAMYGNPSELLTSFNATDNYVEKLMVEHKALPVVIDDRAVSALDKSKRKQIADSIAFIFRLSTGKMKGRLNDSVYSGERIFCPVIMSTEKPLIPQTVYSEARGHFFRMLEIPCVRGELTKDAAHARELDRFLDSYHGIGGESFAKYISQLSKSEMAAKFDDWCNRIEKCLDENVIRWYKRLALILMSASMIRESLDIEMDVDGITKLLAETVLNMHKEASAPTAKYDELRKYVRQYEKYFAASVSDCNQSEHIGHLIINPAGHMELRTTGENLRFMMSGVEPDAIIAPAGKVPSSVELLQQRDFQSQLRKWKHDKNPILLSGLEHENRLTDRLKLYSGEKQVGLYRIDLGEIL